jgi:hypothetical protein
VYSRAKFRYSTFVYTWADLVDDHLSRFHFGALVVSRGRRPCHSPLLSDIPQMAIALGWCFGNLSGVTRATPAVIGCSIVVAVLCPAHILGDIADVNEAIGIELSLIVDRHKNVGASTGLHRGRDARRYPIAANRFDRQRDAERLLALLPWLAVEQLIRDGHDINESQPVQRHSLGKGGS